MARGLAALLAICAAGSASASVCADTDDGAIDSEQYSCTDYTAMPEYLCYYYYDDEDFTHEEMCCACGGGEATYTKFSGDCPGNDLQMLGAVGLSACSSSCDATSGCYGFSFRTQDGFCILKSATCASPTSSAFVFYEKQVAATTVGPGEEVTTTMEITTTMEEMTAKPGDEVTTAKEGTTVDLARKWSPPRRRRRPALRQRHRRPALRQRHRLRLLRQSHRRPAPRQRRRRGRRIPRRRCLRPTRRHRMRTARTATRSSETGLPEPGMCSALW
jgi:hypothetical protein